jgi:PAS domain S-box-containing protein
MATPLEHHRIRDARTDFTLSGFIAAGIAAVAFVSGIYWVSAQQTRAQDLISHTREVLAVIATTRADLIDIQNGQRGFVITGREEDLQPYANAHAAIHEDVRRLRELTTDNAAQQRSAAQLDSALEPRLASAAAVIAARRSGGLDAARALMQSGASAQDFVQLRDILQRMDQEERSLLSLRLGEHQRRLHAFWGVIAVLFVALAAGLVALFLRQRRRDDAEHQLLETERRFHLMTETVTDYAILMLDAAGRVQTWNAGAQQIKGYTEGEILGAHFSCFFTPEDRDAGKPARVLATAAAQGHYMEEGERVRKDGSRFWASVVVTPLKDAHGQVTGYSKITRDMTEPRQAEEARLAHELSARLIAAQEEERRHVARELHDETGQSLTLIRMQLAELAALQGPASEVARECIQVVEHATAHIRALALRLRPPMLDDLGLADALEWVLDQQARAAGWRVFVELPELQDRLPQALETACFRIGQEALTNAARYSGATEVRLALRVADGRVELEICDNGTGFDVERYRSPAERKKHFGLVSMSERAALVGGVLTIDSAPGRRTCIRASLPVAVNEPGSIRREHAALV